MAKDIDYNSVPDYSMNCDDMGQNVTISLNEMLSIIQRSDEIMEEFKLKKDVLGEEYWSDASKLMIDGYMSQMVQAIVMMETFIDSNYCEDVKVLKMIKECLADYKQEYEKYRNVRDLMRKMDLRKKIQK